MPFYNTEQFIDTLYSRKVIDEGIFTGGELTRTDAFAIASGIARSLYILIKNFYNVSHPDVSNTRIDQHLTNKLREITNDKEVVVRQFFDRQINAFNDGSKNVYYCLGTKKNFFTEGELIAVLLHEYGHYIGKHTQKTIVAYSLVGLVSVITTIEVGMKFSGWWKIASIPLNFILEEIFEVPYNTIIGRKQEYFSDSYAVKRGYKKEMYSALEKLAEYDKRMMCGNKKDTPECDRVIEDSMFLDEHPLFADRLKNVLQTNLMKMLMMGKKKGLVKAITFLKGIIRQAKNMHGNKIK